MPNTLPTPDPTTQPQSSDAAQQPVAPTAQPSTPPQSVNDTPDTSTPADTQSPQTTQQPTPNSAQPSQSGSQPDADMVSNTPQVHESVGRASVLRSIAETLAGGPRYQTIVDPNTGATTHTPVPLSRKDIGMALALEAISGSLIGLGAKGPNSIGLAGAMGVQQGEKIAASRTAAQQAQDKQAQQDAKNQSNALVRASSIHESNARTALATAQSERLGIESLKDQTTQNADLLAGYNDAGAVSESNVTQDALSAGMQNGKYNATKQTAVPDGWTYVNGKPEQTFSIIANPAAKVNLTQYMVDQFSSNHVPGFPKGMKIGDAGYPVPGYILSRANLQLQSNKMALQEAGDVANTLAQSSDKSSQELAKSIPDFGKLMDDPQHGLAFEQALPKLQKYQHGGDDIYSALQQMSQPTRPNPTNPKLTINNSNDAKAANVIAGAFGGGNPQLGWQILKKYHQEITGNQIKNTAEAESIASDPTSTPRQVQQAQKFLALDRQQKIAVKAAGKNASGKAGAGTSDPQTIADLGEALAKGSITEDQIPNFNKGDTKVRLQAYLTQHHPNLDQSSVLLDGTERKQRDLARNSIENLNTIQSTLQRRPELLGVIQGRVSQGKELTGTNDPDLATVSQALDNWALASTGAHGIRSVEARRDAKQVLLNSFKNGQNAVNAAINTSRTSLQQFANLGKPKGIDGSAYVYKPQGSGQSQPSGNQSNAPHQVNIPAGAQLGRDAKGQIVGYMLNGQYTPIAGNQ